MLWQDCNALLAVLADGLLMLSWLSDGTLAMTRMLPEYRSALYSGEQGLKSVESHCFDVSRKTELDHVLLAYWPSRKFCASVLVRGTSKCFFDDSSVQSVDISPDKNRMVP